MTKDNGSNRIWIELPVPTTKERGDELAAKVNAMLAKLGCPKGHGFFWSSNDRRPGWCIEQGMGYLTCPDNGHWFNLNYLSSDEPIDPATGWKAHRPMAGD